MVEGLEIPKVKSFGLIYKVFYSEQKAGNEILYICSLGASVGCERLSEHSTRRD